MKNYSQDYKVLIKFLGDLMANKVVIMDQAEFDNIVAILSDNDEAINELDQLVFKGRIKILSEVKNV